MQKNQAIEDAKKTKGRIEIIPKRKIKNFDDFSLIYTPGVAYLSRVIAENADLSFELTSRWNTIAVLSNGTRVLGLGNIGPEAALPVMEGKSVLFKYLGGVDAFPLVIKAKTVEEFVKTAEAIEPAFGGINLEDIKTPDCFYILQQLENKLSIPVWHDDRQGTATIALAGLINSLKLVNKDISQVKIVFFGAGAANISIAELFEKAGSDPRLFLMIDSKGILSSDRKDIEELKTKNPWKYEMALKTNEEKLEGGIEEAIKNADVLITASVSKPGIIKPEIIKKMSKDPIVFLLTNPVPEISPEEAKKAGARIVATGRSDYPNQINNSLVFPGVFRGVLDVRAKRITEKMILAAAKEIARIAEEKGLREDYIVPRMDDEELYPRVAAEVGYAAIKEGFAKIKASKEELYENAKKLIERSRKILNSLF